jgi:hypothetical protein
MGPLRKPQRLGLQLLVILGNICLFFLGSGWDFGQPVLLQFVPQRAEGDSQKLRGVRPVSPGLCQGDHDELFFHFAHGTAGTQT